MNIGDMTRDAYAGAFAKGFWETDAKGLERAAFYAWIFAQMADCLELGRKGEPGTEEDGLIETFKLLHRLYERAEYPGGMMSYERLILAKMALVVTEIGEAIDAFLDDDDAGNYNESLAEELADAVIRVFDLCGGLGIDLEDAIVKKMKINESRPHLHGKDF